jgi:hypothetical protein
MAKMPMPIAVPTIACSATQIDPKLSFRMRICFMFSASDANVSCAERGCLSGAVYFAPKEFFAKGMHPAKIVELC